MRLTCVVAYHGVCSLISGVDIWTFFEHDNITTRQHDSPMAMPITSGFSGKKTKNKFRNFLGSLFSNLDTRNIFCFVKS